MANAVLLQKITVNTPAGVPTIYFNNLPQSGYKDLRIVISARTSASQTTENVIMYFNNDITTGNYYGRRSYGSGAGNSYDSGYIYSVVVNANTATSGVHGVADIYISDYLATTPKHFFATSATSHNASGNYHYSIKTSQYWNSTSKIESIRFVCDTGANFMQYSTISVYGIPSLNDSPILAPRATGGDIVSTDGSYWYHAFLSSGVFRPNSALNCDYMIIAGGGAGGSASNSQQGGGGGGAGGYLSSVITSGGGGNPGQSLSLTNQNYPVIIGAGGTYLMNGANSSFAGLTAIGGGAGAYGATMNGATGGSGGGGSSSSSPGSGGSGTSGQGYAGGAGQGGNNYVTGAGGGAGAVGGNGANANGGTAQGVGGAGLNTLASWATATGTGVSGYFAGGGGSGSGQFANPPSNNGGAGGGGKGAFLNGGSSTAAVAGTANTGGGGGGSHEQGSGYAIETGGKGGSGIVIVRYSV